MRRMVMFAAIAALAISCKVQKTGENTYKVVAPTPQAKTAAERAKVQAREAGEKHKQETRVAAQKTGRALEHAGRQLQEHAKSH